VTTEKSTDKSTEPLTESPLCKAKYDYSDVLQKSLLFYEAQRSGKLPLDNRIPWRKNSTLNDGKDVGHDLTGGYFDAGDNVKFGFPMAAATTVLAWGMIEFADGYKAAGEYQHGLDAIKWATDYFLKCHTADNEFYGQVGDGDVDHAFWGRASEIDHERPAWKIDASKPGSDLAGETSAALAAASIIFKEAEPDYSNLLLQHAITLYDFAVVYKGKYSDSIPNAGKFYKSWSGYWDELTWAAAWLYKAAPKAPFLLDAAEKLYSEHLKYKQAHEFSWDDKTAGVKILLADLTGKQEYKIAASDFCNRIENKPKTPAGMVFIQQWGSNRHAANVAFVCMVAGKYLKDESMYESFARKQIHTLLGDAGRSYVVGFGNNPPTRPHHASASCPDRPTACGWNDLNKSGPNPHVLYGALVGGPKSVDGKYEDKRTDFIMNEVSCDYNAGFQSAIAGLLHYQIKGKC